MLLLTLRGTPTIYQGEELGLTDVPIPPDLVQDPWEKNLPGLGLGRDPVRTPMPWDHSRQAGFTAGQPWLPIGVANAACHAAAQEGDPASILSLYRKLTALRRSEPALVAGDHIPVAATDEVLAYERRDGARGLLIVLNLCDRPQRLTIPGEKTLRLSTVPDRIGERMSGRISLRGNEGIVAEVL